MFYFEVEDLEAHVLVLAPIIAMYFIRFAEALKHSDRWSKFTIFFEMFPRIIISYIICGIVFVILQIILIFIMLILSIFTDFSWMSDNLIKLIDMAVLIFLGTIVSYFSVKDDETYMFFRHKVDSDTWLTKGEERILKRKLKKVDKKDWRKVDNIKRGIVNKRNPEDEYYFWDRKRCIKMDKYKWAKVKEKYEFESEFYTEDIKYF